MKIETKKECIKCKKEHPADSFYRNAATNDGLHYYCKHCTKGRDQEDFELTLKEKSLILKYLPYAHKQASIISKYPNEETKEDSIPLTLRDIARDNELYFGDVQHLFYKLVRLNLATLIVQSDGGGGSNTIVHYKIDNIKKYIFNED